LATKVKLPGPVLVTGGAGYIGSHVVWALADAGYPVVVLDDLSAGRRESLPQSVPLLVGDVGNRRLLDAIITKQRISAVMHFAGSIRVADSVREPLSYYHNNTVKSQALIETCVENRVRWFIFSSTAAVYGVPPTLPILEDTVTRPINPYGTSKLMTELMLRDGAAASDLRYAVLRYFNVAGADPRGRTGESREQPSHLVTLAVQTALGRRPNISVFGEDYETPDGTCIRDYVHVTDLANAHVRALETLVAGGESMTLNCGYSRGFSVREVLRTVEQVSGKALEIVSGPRRAGDPPALVAAADKARSVLGWQPRYDDLAVIVRTAMEWEKRLMAAPARPTAKIVVPDSFVGAPRSLSEPGSSATGLLDQLAAQSTS